MLVSNMWLQIAIDSFTHPREAARRLLDMNIPSELVLQAGVAATCSAMVLAFVSVLLTPGTVDPISAALISRPLATAVAQFAIMIIAALVTSFAGRMFGGQGGFWGALTLIVWLNILMVAVQAVQIISILVFPPLAAMLALATLFWALWAFTAFVSVLHGFTNPMFVLGGVLLTSLVFFFALAMVLAMLGFVPQELR
jgi:hypothetical protein